MSEPLIVLDRLAKSFGDHVAVDALSMSIPKGEVFGFLGANGAGKTTTMRMLCGLTKPTAGSGKIGSRDVWEERARIRPTFGYVAQRFSLYPDLTVLENLRFFGTAYQVTGRKLEDRIESLLRLLDLTGERSSFAGSLSGGMKQMLAVACALVHEPGLLFLDEPTSGLDPVHRQQIWDLLYQLSHEGTTIFVTTHYMDEAERCTELGFLHRGRLLAKESPHSLKQHFKGKLLEIQVEPVMKGLVSIREAEDVLGVALRSGRIRIYSAHAARLLASWQSRWPFADLTWFGYAWVDPDMEDVFKAYSQGYDEILDRPVPAV